MKSSSFKKQLQNIALAFILSITSLGLVSQQASAVDVAATQEYALSTDANIEEPTKLQKGSDGNMWVMDQTRNSFRRVTSAGVVTEYIVPTASAGLTQMTLGGDGNIWFIEENADKVGFITPNGDITEFTTPGMSPELIATDATGRVWFNRLDDATKLMSIDGMGVMTERDLAESVDLYSMAFAPDGTIWISGNDMGKVGIIELDGTVTYLDGPNGFINVSSQILGYATEIISDGKGNMWVRYNSYERASIAVFNIASREAVSITPAPVDQATGTYDMDNAISDMMLGDDGNVWVAGGYGYDKTVHRISADGTMTPFVLPASSAVSAMYSIAMGPSNTIWYIGGEDINSAGANPQIGYFAAPVVTPPVVNPPVESTNTQTPAAPSAPDSGVAQLPAVIIAGIALLAASVVAFSIITVRLVRK